MKGRPVGRFAPTPSGHLHLGNLRTALLAWLWCRSQQGTFLLRVEDVDRSRARRDLEQEQLDDLAWLGLDWDEGPGAHGARGPFRQSERGAYYQRVLERLDSFPCSCTRKELRDSPGGIYPGFCRQGPRQPERPCSIRWRVPSGCYGTQDLLCGPVERELQREVGDRVVRRADGDWTYLLAVVADDLAMGVTQILRGEDLIDFTPEQVALWRCIEPSRPPPHFAHVPLVLGQAGTKLSKREGLRGVVELRQSGLASTRVCAALVASSGLLDAEPDLRRAALEGELDLSPSEAISRFDLGRISGALRRAADFPAWLRPPN